MKILIVEDIQTTVDLIRVILKECRWEMQDCDTVEEAFRIRDNFKPDVILLDLSLRDSTKQETLAAIPRMAQNALIVLTGSSDSETVREALKQGADDCLDKNCLNDKREFIKTIRSAWERYTRKTSISHDRSENILLQITQAEMQALREIPSIKGQVRELYGAVFLDKDCIKTSLGIVLSRIEEINGQARIRTAIVILAFVVNAIVVCVGSYTGHEIKQLPNPEIEEHH